MIVQRPRSGQIRPEAAQRIKEFLRMPNTSKGKQPAVLPGHACGQGGERACQLLYILRQRCRHRWLAWALVIGRANGQQKISARQPHGYWLAQWACWYHPAIAKPPRCVNDDNAQIFGDTWVLEAVIRLLGGMLLRQESCIEDQSDVMRYLE